MRCLAKNCVKVAASNNEPEKATMNHPKPFVSTWLTNARNIGRQYGWYITCSVYFEGLKSLSSVNQVFGVMDDFGNFVEVPDANK